MKKLLTMILLTYGMLASAQTAVFVAADGNDSNNGTSWGAAKKTIAAGITAAGGNGTVYVKAGEYAITAQIVIPAGVSVKGGYGLASSGTDTTRRELPGTNSRWENTSICTIITGNGSHRIASVSGLLEGCILRRGYTNTTGGGAYIDGGMVRYCVIRECDAINESTLAAEGGGAYILNGGTLTNCVVTECRGDKGPAVSGGNGSLINNTITRNWPTHCGTVADFDGNVYNTVVIGQQCWTKQNLRTTHYNDGTAIPKGNSNSETEPRYYVNYNAVTSTMLTNYGYLYNWPAVMHGAPSSNSNPSGVTGICPPGWHVPSDAEWTEMTDFVNSITRYRCSGYDAQIAKSLSSKSGWNSSNSACEVGNNQGGNNATLFNAFPAGWFLGSLSEIGSSALFWSSRESSETNAWTRRLYPNSNAVERSNYNKAHGFSVRCVKQAGSTLPVVHTTEAIMNTSTQALVKGFCQDAGSEITNYGFCWGTSQNPTVEGNHIQGVGVAQFSGVISGLTSGVTYYVRAYAVNHAGISYGEERTLVSGGCGTITVTDYDGNQYNTVQIGSQCWMKENLRVTHFSNGSDISLDSVTSSTTALRYYPNNDSTIVNDFGYLYNWPATSKDLPYSMPSSGSATMTVLNQRIIYDDGGPNGNYSNYCNSTLTLVPAVEGSHLTISGNYYTESCCDHLYVYDGIGTSQLIGTYQGQGTLNVTSQSGPLTIQFTSDYSAVYSGFTLTVVSSVSEDISLCPTGWHLPSDAEWTQLTDYLSSTAADVCGGNTANIAKSIAASSGWSSSSVECAVGNDPSNNNLLNFGALPAGAYNGNYVKFGEGAYYWSATPNSATQSWRRSITHDSPSVARSSTNNVDAYSVRCVRNE